MSIYTVNPMFVGSIGTSPTYDAFIDCTVPPAGISHITELCFIGQPSLIESISLIINDVSHETIVNYNRSDAFGTSLAPITFKEFIGGYGKIVIRLIFWRPPQGQFWLNFKFLT
jgi:hypothetical protein